MNVPYWNTFSPSLESCTTEQREIYHLWSTDIKNGIYRDVEGNLAYIFVYLYDVLNTKDLEWIYQELSKIKKFFDFYPKINSYCNRWIADYYILKGDMKSAYQYNPSSLTLKIINNKFTIKDAVENYLSLDLTDYGRGFIEEIKVEAESIIKEYEEHNKCDSLKECITSQPTYYAFGGSSLYMPTKIPLYNFNTNKFHLLFPNILVEAENRVRVRNGIPKIGEGWIAETILFYQIKAIFSKYITIHHGKPKFLGSQHLDIYLPELKIGIEYQGDQHSVPIDYFGGEVALRKTQERDERKRLLCEKHGLSLIYVFPGYDINDVVKEIIEKCSKKNLKVNYNLLSEEEFDCIKKKIDMPTVKKNISKKETTEKTKNAKIFKRKEMADIEIINEEKFFLRMLQTDNLLDRHIIFYKMVLFYYTYRDKDGFIEKCKNMCKADIEIFEDCKILFQGSIAITVDGFQYIAEQKDYNMFLFTFFSFKRLAMLYEKEGKYEKAINICEKALKYGLRDGTNGGFSARIKRLRKKIKT